LERVLRVGDRGDGSGEMDMGNDGGGEYVSGVSTLSASSDK
jgi:hypothetical protein